MPAVPGGLSVMPANLPPDDGDNNWVADTLNGPLPKDVPLPPDGPGGPDRPNNPSDHGPDPPSTDDDDLLPPPPCPCCRWDSTNLLAQVLDCLTDNLQSRNSAAPPHS